MKYQVRRPVALLGKNATSLKLASYFQKNRKLYDFSGFLADGSDVPVNNPEGFLQGTCEQIKRAAENGIREIYISFTTDRVQEFSSLMQEADRHCIHLKFVPDLSQILLPAFSMNQLGGLPIVTLRTEPLEEIQNRFRKRVFDLCFSIAVIIGLLSWLLPLVYLLIVIESRGPLLFKQLRSGKDNRTFWCYKFRSMRVNEECDRIQASHNDTRVTRFGKFMRRTSLDELPQFFNVLMGEMSIVGPRPHMLKQTEQYSELIQKYMVRQNLKPGITGWAQVNGLRGETSTLAAMEKRVEQDIWYLENWSLMLDIKIIFMTLINVVKGDKNAY